MEKGRLEITEEILDRVVYGMENQDDRLFLDPNDGQLREKTAERKALIPLPSWGSTEGYRLMDRFIATLPDTPFRNGLSDILRSGGGVFRRFKDALRERPGMEELWRRYKQREMRRTALVWLSRWSDALALESLGPEPEELDDLALSEFSFREAGLDEESAVHELRMAAHAEFTADLPNFLGGAADIAHRPAEQAVSVDEFVAEGPDGSLIGFSRLEDDGGLRSGGAVLTMVYVRPEYRGLGIGRHLTESALERASGSGGPNLGLITAGVGDGMRRWLEEAGFSPVAMYWRRTR